MRPDFWVNRRGRARAPTASPAAFGSSNMARYWACRCGVTGHAATPTSFHNGPKDQTSDGQLHIGESPTISSIFPVRRLGMTAQYPRVNAFLTINRAKIAE